jgi:hypothetical protein
MRYALDMQKPSCKNQRKHTHTYLAHPFSQGSRAVNPFMSFCWIIALVGHNEWIAGEVCTYSILVISCNI